MESNLNIALFASGTGTNADNLITHAKNHLPNIHISCVITDKANAGVIDRARKQNIEVFVVEFEKLEGKPYSESKKVHEEKILQILEGQNIDWVLMCGYMRILSEGFLKNFYDSSLEVNKVVNLHPSYLPAFPGKDSYERAFEAGVETSGVTLHFVDDGVDTGRVIMQEKFKRSEADSLEDFIQKGRALEYKMYPKVLEQISKGIIS